MVKSHFSLGGKLLTIFLTIVIFLGAVVGAVFAVYKSVKVRTLADLFGAKDWISEEYDGTIEQFVQKVSTALNGEISVNTLTEISPKIGEYADLILDNAEQIGLFKFDRKTLYSTNVSQISSALTEMLVLTGTLSDLSAKLNFPLPQMDVITGNESKPIDVYTKVNPAETGALAKEFDAAFTGKTYEFYTREQIFEREYTDENGIKYPVSSVKTEKLFTLSGADATGNTLKFNGATLYLKQTSGTASVYTPLTKNSSAVYAVNGTEITFTLSETERICTHTAPGETDGSYTEIALTDTGKSNAVTEIAAPYRYKPLYAQRDAAPETGEYIAAGGKFYLPVNEKGADGKYAVNADKGGFAVKPEYADETLYAAAYLYRPSKADAADAKTALYVKTNGIKDLPVTFAMTALSSIMDVNALSLADVGVYFGVELNNDLLNTVKYVPLAYFSASMNGEMNGIALKDVITITPDSPAILRFFAYGEEGKDYKIENGAFVMIGDAKPKTVGQLTANVNSLKISDAIDIVTDGESAESGKPASHPLMQTIADWTLNDFADASKIGSLTIGNVMKIDAESPAILQLLADVPLDGVGKSIDSFTIGDILGNDLGGEDKILGILKNSTLKTLSSDLQNMTVQATFADSIYAYHEVARADTGTLAEIYAAHKDAYRELLYVYVRGKYVLYNDYLNGKNSEYKHDDPKALYSPYLQVTETEKYKNVPLYALRLQKDGTYKYELATAVTAWKLPNGETSATYYTDKNGSAAAVPDQNGYYAQSVLYRWDAAAEKTVKITLIPAVYGSTDTKETTFARLIATGYTGTDFLSDYGNLFWYDTEREQWQQVPLKPNGEGKYTFDASAGTDAAALAGKALYTYGTPQGAWKYLVMKDGTEVRCTLQNIDSLMANVQSNINKLTLRTLYEDGMISITAPEGQTPESMLNKTISLGVVAPVKIGDLTLDGMINLIFALANSAPVLP